MPRTARIVIPNMVHHVVHRACNRDPIFLGEDEYVHYLRNLDECRQRLKCRIHAFCIMLNHVHLLVDPGSEPANLARLMKCLAARQARYLRKSEMSRGPRWEGRFRSSPVADDFILPCARYIELNPVRACLVDRPQDYPWSSARSRLGLTPTLVDFDKAYLSLGRTPGERFRHYEAYLRAPIPLDEWSTIRRAIQSAGITGDRDFRATVAAAVGRAAVGRPRGRPRSRGNAEVRTGDPGFNETI